MVSFLVLIGFMAFVSGYVVSLEDRLQRDGKFFPFSVLTNLKASRKARKVLTWLGMLIWAIAVVCYIFGPQQSFSIKDNYQQLFVVVIVFVFMFMGHARELEFKKNGKSAASYNFLDVIEGREWLFITFKAISDVAKIFFF